MKVLPSVKYSDFEDLTGDLEGDLDDDFRLDVLVEGRRFSFDSELCFFDGDWAFPNILGRTIGKSYDVESPHTMFPDLVW